MILADSSIWIDHLRHGEEALLQLMADVELLVHPFVIGEVALGQIKSRTKFLAEMSEFEVPVIATDDEVLLLMERLELSGKGLGLVDVHLLGSTLVTVDAKLWTRDKRLAGVAKEAGVLANLP